MRRAIVGAATAAVLPLLAGCGSEGSVNNGKVRPPVVRNVTASITRQGEVLVSPKRFGAGPVHLIVTNQSDRSRELSLQSTSGDAGEADARSGPINPQGTAELNLKLTEGSYRVVASDAARASTIDVGPERPSSQTEVLQP